MAGPLAGTLLERVGEREESPLAMAHGSWPGVWLPTCPQHAAAPHIAPDASLL